MPAVPAGPQQLPERILDAALQGDQDTYWRLLGQWLQTLPWTGLILSTLGCGLVGAWLGRRHGRLWAGLGWGLLLGPFGWPLAARNPRRKPPPLPR
ncbi:hypothetical protein ACYJW8_06035 [Frateuria aurantia]